MKIKNISLFLLASMAAMLVAPLVSSAQTTDVCTGAITIDKAAAEACAAKAEQQGAALGYTLDCNVEVLGLIGNVNINTGLTHVLNTQCTVNGSGSFAPQALVGYSTGPTIEIGEQSNVATSWSRLADELKLQANNGSFFTSNTTGSNTTSNTSTGAAVQTSADGQISFTSTGCVIFNTNLIPPGWGTGVNALGRIMTKENLMVSRPDLGITNAADTILGDAIYNYQVKYKILSNTNLTLYYDEAIGPPLYGTYGPVYGSRNFDTITRNFVNSKCYKLPELQTSSTNTSTNTNTTGTTNTGTVSSVSYASSLLKIINQMVVNLKAQLQSIQNSTQ